MMISCWVSAVVAFVQLKRAEFILLPVVGLIVLTLVLHYYYRSTLRNLDVELGHYIEQIREQLKPLGLVVIFESGLPSPELEVISNKFC